MSGLTHGNAPCIAHLDAGGLVLTADLRQARILRRLHDQAQIAAGRDAWPTAQVLPLEAWLAAQWRDAGTTRDELPVALPAVATRWLWRRLVAADAPGLVDPAETGARARVSWLELRAHGGSVGDLARWPLTRDQQAFVAWAHAAERALDDRRACDAGDLVRRVLESEALPPPGPPVLLVGFSRPTPAQAELFEALHRRGWSIDRFGVQAQAGPAFRHAAADPESERAALVGWLRLRLSEAPGGVHGVIVPSLAAERGALERLLEAGLQPELEVAGASRQRVFDLAGGSPLSAQPVIEIALDAIRFALGRGDGATASRLLRSAQLAGSAAEQEARLRLDARWRREGRPAPQAPAELSREARLEGAPAFATALATAAGRMAGPARRTAGAWAEAFGSCLAAWGWPGGTSPGSADWQASMRLTELLRELGAISAFATELTSGGALAELEELAAAPFQPEGGEPAVFVMDGWEEPGLAFDSLWVAGLTATAWPRPVRIDPFLPIEAQRRLRMPRATADACVAESEAITASWRSQAGTLTLSWPQREDDTDADASALVSQALPGLPVPAAFRSRAALQCGAADLEVLADDVAPILLAGRAAGGARVLELQARCPFRAFGELRLHARPFEEPLSGFDRRLRGQILHRALERFWTGLRTQAALLALAPAACRERTEAAIDQALAELAPALAGPRARALERDWQLATMEGLIGLDRRRPAFTVVETEREMTGHIGGLELRLRVDRVDEADGARVVIDYKTGRAHGTSWRGARMDAPQLPLYAVLHARRPDAIALAEAGFGGARFVGVGEETVAIDGVLPAEKYPLTEDRKKGFGWGSITEHWWAWLESLAKDHAAGRAEVDPKLAGQTCRHCHLGALCRVDPAGARDDGDEEADGDI
ncbi:MAG TPA: PD-(D/E)XK nuclease family protein [Steroidobacteraceae bacterium]|nr:PD-(D/E)XK nuclease family protein [Steroidobacteraceae bacterium]